MPVHADLPTRMLHLWHERRTVIEMSALLDRPEDEVREALVMLGVVKAPEPFATTRMFSDHHMNELQAKPPLARPLRWATVSLPRVDLEQVHKD